MLVRVSSREFRIPSNTISLDYTVSLNSNQVKVISAGDYTKSSSARWLSIVGEKNIKNPFLNSGTIDVILSCFTDQFCGSYCIEYRLETTEGTMEMKRQRAAI